MAKRKSGYYWVQEQENGTWIIAEWIGSSFWWIPGSNDEYCDADFITISETPIKRSKPVKEDVMKKITITKITDEAMLEDILVSVSIARCTHETKNHSTEVVVKGSEAQIKEFKYLTKIK